MIESVIAYLADDGKRILLQKLSKSGVSRGQAAIAAPGGGPLSGKSFCVTGVLSRPREAIHASIINAGGIVHDKVKKGTHFLVAGEKVGQSKLDAAKKHGVSVIDETQLLTMISA